MLPEALLCICVFTFVSQKNYKSGISIVCPTWHPGDSCSRQFPNFLNLFYNFISRLRNNGISGHPSWSFRALQDGALVLYEAREWQITIPFGLPFFLFGQNWAFAFWNFFRGHLVIYLFLNYEETASWFRACWFFYNFLIFYVNVVVVGISFVIFEFYFFGEYQRVSESSVDVPFGGFCFCLFYFYFLFKKSFLNFLHFNIS